MQTLDRPPTTDLLKNRILTALESQVPTEGLPPLIQAALPLGIRIMRQKLASASPEELLTFVKSMIPQLMDLLSDDPEELRACCESLGARYAYLWER